MRVSTRWDRLRPGLRAAGRRTRRWAGRAARATSGPGRMMHRLPPATYAAYQRVELHGRLTMWFGGFGYRADAAQANSLIRAEGEARTLVGSAAIR